MGWKGEILEMELQVEALEQNLKGPGNADNVSCTI